MRLRDAVIDDARLRDDDDDRGIPASRRPSIPRAHRSTERGLVC
jgi:hypothetical protein